MILLNDWEINLLKSIIERDDSCDWLDALFQRWSNLHDTVSPRICLRGAYFAKILMVGSLLEVVAYLKVGVYLAAARKVTRVNFFPLF